MELSSNWISDETDIAGSLQLYSDDLPEALSELLDEDAGFILSQPKLIKEKCHLQLNGHSYSPQDDSSCISNPIEQLKRSLNSHANEWPRIKSITVLSESKLVEVFIGKHEEYLGSFSSTILEQFSDSLICRTVINLGKPQSCVKLIFKNTYDNTSLMVYGVFAQTAAKGSIEGNSKFFPSSSRFSSNHLDSVLSEHGVTTLSKEATLFKKVLQQYNDRPRERGAVATPSFSFSGLVPLLGESGTAGPAMLSNLAALIQKQFPKSDLSKFETIASGIKENSEKTLVSGAKLETIDSITNSNCSVLKSDRLVTDSDECNGNSVSPSGPLNSHVHDAELLAAASFLRKSDIVPENILCEDVTRMDISPVDESRRGNSYSSCTRETPTPAHIFLHGTDSASQNNVRVDGLQQVNGNLIHLLPVRDCSDKISGQLLKASEVRESSSNDGHLNAHLIGLFENIIDKKLAAFEKKIETMVSQKLSETTANFFTKLNSIEGPLVGVSDKERSSSIT